MAKHANAKAMGMGSTATIQQQVHINAYTDPTVRQQTSARREARFGAPIQTVKNVRDAGRMVK